MRILHVGKFYPPHMGGTEIYTRDLIRQHSESAEIRIVVSSDTKHREVVTVDGAELTRLPTLATLASMPVSLGLLRYLLRNTSDIVHIHMPNPLAALFYLLCGHCGRLVLTHHADTLGRPYLRRISDPFVRIAMKRADAIIVTSQRYLDSSTELAGFRNKCHVIPLGIDSARFLHDDSARIRDLHRQHGDNLIIAIGRLVMFKGFHLAIEALAQVPTVKLLIVGEGPCRNYLQTLAMQFGVADRVVFLGCRPNEEIPSLIKASKIVLFPSTRRTESFGYVQLEALACGVPIVNTLLDTAASEVSLHRVTGLTVPPRNASALASAIQHLLSEPTLRSEYGRAGLDRVGRLYKLDLMANQTIALYREVLERSAATRNANRVPHFLQAILKKWRESPV